MFGHRLQPFRENALKIIQNHQHGDVNLANECKTSVAHHVKAVAAGIGEVRWKPIDRSSCLCRGFSVAVSKAMAAELLPDQRDQRRECFPRL
jgi:hypothetical protein